MASSGADRSRFLGVRVLRSRGRRDGLRGSPRGPCAARRSRPPDDRRLGDRIVREAEAAVDERDARDRAVDAGEAVLDVDRAGPYGAQQRASLDAHAGLGEADVGRCEVARPRQLVAGDVVLGDEDRPRRRAPRRGRRRSVRRSGRTRRRRRRREARRARAADRRCRSRWHRRRPRTHATRDASRCTARPRTSAPRRSAPSPRRMLDAESSDLALEPLDERPVRPGDGGEPTQTRRPLDELDLVPTHAPRPAPSPAPPDHRRRTTTSLGMRGRRVPVGILGLASRSSARRCTSRSGCGRRGPGTSGCSGCTAGSRRPRPRAELGDEVGIGDLGPGHLDGVAHGRRRRRRAPTRPGRRRRPSPAGHDRRRRRSLGAGPPGTARC